MKTYFIILILFFTGLAARAQDEGDDKGKIRDRMNEYIQDRLGLSKREAEKFSPVFLRYFQEFRQIRRENRTDNLVLKQKIIDLRTEPWGINVISVEIKDVLIPSALEDAMSMQAQAERERQARVILGDSERQIAEKFEEAAKTYANNPTALHLRAMNMLYEGLKQNSTFVIVPSSVLETMQLGAPAGLRPQANGVAHSGREELAAKHS